MSASAIVQRWIDEDGVDAVVDVPTSSVALAVQESMKEKGKVFLISGAASSDLTGKACSPTGVHWTYDTYALAHGTGAAMVKQGGDTWFFITADYAFGHALQRDTAGGRQAAGGKVLGSVDVPLNNADFSSFLLQAQQSKAKIIGLANAGGDTDNSIKQAAEFGIVAGGQKLAGLLVFISDVNSLGLPGGAGAGAHRGVLLGPERRDPRLVEALHGADQEAADHGAGRRLRRGDALSQGDRGRQDRRRPKVVAKMRELPINDFMTKNGKLREDGRVMRDMYLFQVKTPAESKYQLDYYKQLATIPADQAFRPLSESECPLVKKG